MRLRFTVDYRRDLVGLWYYRKICGEHCLSFRLPFTRQGLVPRRRR